MRRLNFKLLLGLVIVVVSLGAGVHVLHGLQSTRSATALLHQADFAEKAGDRTKAARYLERYLSYSPGDAVALTRFAKLVLPEDPRSSPVAALSAIKALEKALTVDPELKDDRRKVADLFMKLGRPEDYAAALTHLNVLTASEPDDAELESMRGRCLEDARLYEEAARAYEKARRNDPHRVEAYARLAGLLRRRLNKPTQADRVMDALEVKDGVVAANGRSAQAYLERSRYRKEFNLPGSGDDAARALELAPDDADALLAAAEAALGKGKGGPDEARGLLERGVKAHPKDVRMYSALAAVESASARFAGAIAALERGLKVFPDSLELQWLLAEAQISGGKLAEAGEGLKRLAAAVDRMPMKSRDRLLPQLRYEGARVLMGRNRWPEAAEAMERAASELKAQPELAEQAKRAYLQLGRCYTVLGDADKQFAAYRQAAAVTLPGAGLDLEARLGLAGALAARNKFDEAVAEYRRILTLPSAPPGVRFALARLYVLRDLRLPESQRRWADAEQALAEAERVLPGSAEVAVLRAEVFLATGKPDDAARAVRAAREASPDRVDLWVAEADLAFRGGKADEALKRLDEAEARLGRPVVLRQSRAVILARRGGPKAVEALAAIEDSAADLGGDDRRRLLTSLADAYTLAGDPARSRRLVRRLAGEEPDNLPLRLVLFAQALNEGDEADADRLLGEIRRLDTGNSEALLAEAELLTRRATKDNGASLARARTLLGEAARRRPNWPPVALAEARIDEVQGQPESALGNYLRAIELGERSPSAVLRATQLLAERGRFNEAGQVFQKLRDQTAMTGDQQRMAADLAWRARDFDRALAQARAAVAADRKDFRNPLFLGRILFEMAKQDEAEGRKSDARLAEAGQAFRRSVELAKDDPAPRVELVAFLAVTGRKAEGVELTRKAEMAARSGLDFLALGRCYEAVGDAAKASGSYGKAVEAAPEDPVVLQNVADYHIRNFKLKEAEVILRKLAGLGTKVPHREAARARRALALIVASAGNPKRVAEALDMLGTAEGGGGPERAQGGDTVEDRRARVEILAAQPDKDQRRLAIGILADLVKEGAATAADRRLLAGLYDSDGDWPRSREIYRALTESDGKDPNLVAAYALGLMRHKELDEADKWAARLDELRPGSAEATELRARLLHARGRKPQSVALVEAFAKGKDDMSWTFARVLESLGEHAAAEPLYRKAAVRPGGPVERVGLIRFLTRHGRTGEALKLCEAAWGYLKPAEASALSVKALTEGKASDPTAFERVATRLEQAVKANPGMPSIRFDLANLRTYQGKCDTAEAIYREYFEKNPKIAAPLNNIAWLLALQEGKGAEALATIERAIAMDGDVPSLLDTRAMAYLALGKPAEAIADLNRAVASEPTADQYFHLARAYQAADRRDEAGEALRKAKELGLAPAELHPLERPSYERLVAVMAKP